MGEKVAITHGKLTRIYRLIQGEGCLTILSYWTGKVLSLSLEKFEGKLTTYFMKLSIDIANKSTKIEQVCAHTIANLHVGF
jgi:ubiquinone biosynthesis protein UbiJ